MNDTRPKKRSGLEKLLIGCAVGCGGLVVAGLMAGGFGALWFFTPGKQIGTDRIVGDDTLGVVRSAELAEDPGTQELITHALRSLDKINRRQAEEALPESMKWIHAFQRSPSARDLNQIIPKEATIIFERVDGDPSPHVVAALNFRTMIRPMKTALALAARADDTKSFASEYRGHAVYNLEDEAVLAFVESTMLFTDSAAALEKAIDRIADAPPATAGAPSRLDSEAPKGVWDFAGFLPNENGLVADLLDGLVSEEDLAIAGEMDEDLVLRFGIDVVSADEVTAKAVFDCRDLRRAGDWLERLEAPLERLRERAEERDMTLAVDTMVRGREVVVALHLTGLEAAIESAVLFGFAQ